MCEMKSFSFLYLVIAQHSAHTPRQLGGRGFGGGGEGLGGGECGGGGDGLGDDDDDVNIERSAGAAVSGGQGFLLRPRCPTLAIRVALVVRRSACACMRVPVHVRRWIQCPRVLSTNNWDLDLHRVFGDNTFYDSHHGCDGD